MSAPTYYLETDGPVFWSEHGWTKNKEKALRFTSPELAEAEIEDNVEVRKPAFDGYGWIELPVSDPKEYVEIKVDG